jgi:hypothetical protein
VKLRWYRFLDSFQSFIRSKTKEIRERRRWGKNWRDMTRSGRVYRRVQEIHLPYIPQGEFANGAYELLPQPGWEWTCPNCKEYSLITESMMPTILKEWQDTVQRMTYTAAAKSVKVKIPPKPTAATAGCTNCKYRPGSPE